MIPRDSLKDLLTKPGYDRSEKILMCLGLDPEQGRQVREIKEIAVSAGLRAASRWNISQILKDTGSLVARTECGWELTTDGRYRLAELAGSAATGRAVRVAAGLRHHLAALNDPDTKAFIEEAVSCLEHGLYRAAVVLSWVGAVSVLQDHIVAHKLTAFNTEAIRRDSKWKPAKSKDDLSRMKEFDFLTVLGAISVLGKSARQELEAALRLRNGCGHPNSLKVGEARAAAHVESLMLNVFGRF